jgi:hypothetical protein
LRIKSLALTASLLLALVLSGVAAGAQQSSPPKKWVSVFCGSVVTWEKTVRSDTAKLNATLASLKKGGHANIPAVKAKLVGFLGSVVHSTDKMISQIKHVGAPDVKNGSKIQSGVLSAFTQLDNAFKQAKSSAQKLPTGSAKAFSTKADALAKTIQSSANRIGVAFSALDKYSTADLNDAAKNDKTCAKLGG